jgi:hypothetical protein
MKIGVARSWRAGRRFLGAHSFVFEDFSPSDRLLEMRIEFLFGSFDRSSRFSTVLKLSLTLKSKPLHFGVIRPVGFPLGSMLGKKYKPSSGKEVRSVETIHSSLDMRVKPMPLSSTMCEMPPHTNMVAAPRQCGNQPFGQEFH